jgi:hypothetical protein
MPASEPELRRESFVLPLFSYYLQSADPAFVDRNEGTHLVISGLNLTHTFKLHSKEPKTFNTSPVKSGRKKSLLEFHFLHECGDISERGPQLPQTRDLTPV